jgi:hypothetical protein
LVFFWELVRGFFLTGDAEATFSFVAVSLFLGAVFVVVYFFKRVFFLTGDFPDFDF